MRFYAHHECMRAVASPAFAFPTPKQLDKEGREMVEQMEDADREFSKLPEEELRKVLGGDSDSV